MTFSTGVLSSGRATTTTVGGRTSEESRRLARAIGVALADTTGEPLRGVVQAPLRTLGDLNVPGVLVEVGCLSDEASAEALLDPVQQGRIADGIARGISAFLNNEDPDTKPVVEDLGAMEPEA
jgi:N-acetylmuramoyl-L-alanine amidase